MPGSLKYAVRGLGKHPGLVFVALLTLTLGIGATTAIFSVVDAVLLRPLPYPDADRLLILGDNALTGKRGTAWSWLNSRDVAADAKTLAGAATYQADGYTLTGRGAARRVRGLTVSADLFRVVGVQPIVGRGFSPGEDQPGKNRVAVIGHAFWKSELEGDRDVIGKSITIDGALHQIVGVMPPGFRFPVGGKEIEVYAPFPHSALDVGLRDTRGARYLNVVGRLANGASLPQANAELAAISHRLSAPTPRTTRRSRSTRCTCRTGRSRMSAPRCGSFSARSGSCCSSPAPTSPTCSWRGPPRDGARSPSGSRSAPPVAVWYGTCSSRICSCRWSAARSGSSSPCGGWTGSAASPARTSPAR